MPSTTSPAYAPLPTTAPVATPPVGTGAAGTTGGTAPGAVGAGAGTAASTGRGGMTCVPASGAAGAALEPTLGAAVAGRTTSRTAAAVEVARRGARMESAFLTVRVPAADGPTRSIVYGERYTGVKRSPADLGQERRSRHCGSLVKEKAPRATSARCSVRTGSLRAGWGP